MRISKKDFDRASEGVIPAERAEALWEALEAQSKDRPGFDLPNVAYYFGALVVISAMGWFMTLGWESFGGGGILAIALSYALVFALAGLALRRREGLGTPGGLLVTLAVCMMPLAVYGFERATGLWVQGDPGEYRGFYDWVKGGWFLMEVATIAAGLLALRFVRFPFLTAPVAFALWFMSMDLTPLLYGGSPSGDEYQRVSLFFGLAVLAGSYLVDLLVRSGEDYAFWGYLFGSLAFWGGLSLLGGGGELDWFFYGLVNLGLILASVLLARRVFAVFGGMGVFAYLAHLSGEVFEDSMLFPFVLSGVGLAIIALGVLYAKNKERIERGVQALLPAGARRLLPRERTAR